MCPEKFLVLFVKNLPEVGPFDLPRFLLVTMNRTTIFNSKLGQQVSIFSLETPRSWSQSLYLLCWTSLHWTSLAFAKWAPVTMRKLTSMQMGSSLSVSPLIFCRSWGLMRFLWMRPITLCHPNCPRRRNYFNFLLHWKGKRGSIISTPWARPLKMEFYVIMTSQCRQWLHIMHMCAWRTCCWSKLGASDVCLRIATLWLKPSDFRWCWVNWG